MRFAIGSEHLDFFRKKGHIGFESVFTETQIEELSTHVDTVLSKRLQKMTETRSPKELFMAGRDLWRDDPVIKSFVCNRKLAEIAAALFERRQLQIGFDQLLATTQISVYSLGGPLSLQQLSSIQPLAGGALIRLSKTASSHPLLPDSCTTVVFISPTLPIPWELFFETPHQSFLLITYALPNALYLLEKSDPHVHALKKLGYVFGDKLKPELHPTVFR